MKSKMLLLVSMGALALGASAQNVNLGYVRGSARQPNAITKSASATGASSIGASARQPNALGKSASAADASSDVGASVVLGVIDHRRDATSKTAGASSVGASVRQPNAVGISASSNGLSVARH